MMGMSGMDCCKTAQMSQLQAPEVQAAKVCCAVNCPQSGTTGTTSSIQITQPLPTATLATLEPRQTLTNLFPRFLETQPRPQPTQPTYIRHAALLI